MDIYGVLQKVNLNFNRTSVVTDPDQSKMIVDKLLESGS